MPIGIENLIKSRKFWTLMMDLVISLILYFGGKYMAPSVMEDVRFFIGAMQPVFLFLIAAIAYEDGQESKAMALVAQIESERNSLKMLTEELDA